MDLSDFLQEWPFLFHITAALNLASIEKQRRLYPATSLLKRSGNAHLMDCRRENDIHIKLSGLDVVLRSQSRWPLTPNRIEFEAGWTLPKYIRALNSRVFFWPGKSDGPARGRHMAERLNRRPVTILRVSTASLLHYNNFLEPLFSPYDTGVVNCEERTKIRRGDSSFLSSSEFDREASKVVEVSFDAPVHLPHSTCVAFSLDGEWSPLGGHAGTYTE